jgi:DNA-binding transcriptional LysR family regulator
MPRTTLELVPLDVAAQEQALDAGRVDAALVRPPVDTDRWHLIRLYEETVIVVFSADSHLAAGEELTPGDLEGEVLIVPADDVLDPHVAGTLAPAFAAPPTTADAIEIVASGVGIVIVPMSLARLHHRKDVEYRPLSGAATSPVGFAWPREDASPLVDAFIGIVRGRTAQSSRD